MRSILALTTLGLFAQAHANVFLQGFYWDVPSIPAGNGATQYWWDHLAQQANSIRLSGFTGVWIPPVLKGASGGYSMGYDPFDDYDIGSKDQRGTIPTRFGTREQLERCCAMFRANGLEIYADMVHNHRNGDPGNYAFNYVDAYGNASGGRFGKSYYDFHPNVAEDPHVWDNPELSFGRDLAPINGPSGWIYNGLIDAGDWLTKALDLQGYRLDYVKGISTDWLYPFLTSQSMSGRFAVGEFWDGDVNNVETWVNSMQGRPSAFDFPLRDRLKTMCDFPASFDMSALDHAGLTGIDPTHAVTFVENHDTDKDTSAKIYNNKMLAYAYTLTSEGYPSVFYKDWSTDAGCYGGALQGPINNLIWIHEKLAGGTTVQRWKNKQVIVYERQGGSKLLVCLNNNVDVNNPTQGWGYNLYCQTGFGANVQLHDYTGHAADVTTDATGGVNLALPAAVNGMGYCCYAPVGAASGGFVATPIATTQEYAGAQDLDIRPADDTTLVQAARIYAQAGQTVTGTLYWNSGSWTSSTTIYAEVRDGGNNLLTSRSFDLTTPQGSTFTFTPPLTAFYTVNVRSYNTPAANQKPPYWLRMTYTAPQTFPSGVSALSVSTTAVVAGGSLTGRVTLPQAAGVYGVTVSLSSSSAAVVVPATVTVPEGATSATFSITTTGVDANTPATISATDGATTKTASVTVNAAVLTSLTMNAASVFGGKTAYGKISLNGKAGASGKSVTLSTSSASALPPSTFTVPSGATNVQFPIATKGVDSVLTATLSAKDGAVTKTATLIVNPAVVLSLIPASNAVGGNKPKIGVYLNGVAGPSGLLVSLASDNPALTLPASLRFANNQSYLQVTGASQGVDAATNVTVTGTTGTTSVNCVQTLNPASIVSFTVSPTSVQGGAQSNAAIVLNGLAGPSGFVATVASNTPFATSSSPIPIGAQKYNVAFHINTSAVDASTAATITASGSGGSKNATLTIKPATIVSLALNPSTVQGGTSSTGTVTLSGKAGPSGTVVTLTSTNARATVPTSVSVAAGKTSATFPISTSAVTGANVVPTIKATANGTTASANLTITP